MANTLESIVPTLLEPVLDAGSSSTYDGASMYTEVFHHEMAIIFDIIVSVIDIMTVAVIVYGFVYAIFMFVQMHVHQWFGKKHTAVDLSVIRVKLGSYLLLALELFIAADIILTIGEPTLAHLGQLAAIIVIRIAIAHFLQKEMTELSESGVHH